MGSMSLPVSAARPTAGPADLVRLFHRAQLQRARAIAEETVLDGGTWVRNADLQPLADANCVLDAAVDPGATAAELVAEVDRLSAGCPVRGWTLNPSLPADRTQPLADHLARTGWVPDVWDVYHLARFIAKIAPVPGLSVIPVRAAYGRYRALMADRYMDDRYGDLRAEAAMLSLDDPHHDGWLALRNGVAVAAASLLNDGETGTVTDLYVAIGDRGRGIGRLMLARALEASGRSGHQHVLAGVRSGVGSDAGSGAAGRLLAAAGFGVIGRWVRHERAA